MAVNLSLSGNNSRRASRASSGFLSRTPTRSATRRLVQRIRWRLIAARWLDEQLAAVEEPEEPATTGDAAAVAAELRDMAEGVAEGAVNPAAEALRDWADRLSPAAARAPDEDPTDDVLEQVARIDGALVCLLACEDSDVAIRAANMQAIGKAALAIRAYLDEARS
jgi:hypothetical protein